MYSIPDWNSSQSEEDKKKKKFYDIPDWSVTRKDEKPAETSRPAEETLIKKEEKPAEKNIFQQVGDAVSGFFNSKPSTPASFQDVIPTPKQKQNSTTKFFQDELQASSEKKNTVRSFIVKATEDKVYTDNVIAQGQAKEGDIKYNQELNTVLSDKSIEDTNLFSGQKALQDKIIEYSKLPSGSDNLSKFKEIVGDINKIKANDALSIQERLDPMVKQVGDDIGKFITSFFGGIQDTQPNFNAAFNQDAYKKQLIEKDIPKVQAGGELVSNMFGTLADSTGTIVEGGRSFNQLAIEGLPESDTKNYLRSRQIASEESWANLLGKTDFLKQENDPTKSLFNRTEALFISNEKTKKIDQGGAFLSAEVRDGQLKVSANETAWKDYLEISGWVLPMGIGGTKIAAKSIATGIGGAMMGLSSSPELFTRDAEGYTTGISSDALNRGLIGWAIGAATPALAEGMSNGIMKVLGKGALVGTPAQLAIELPTYIGTVYTLAKLTGASDKEALNAAAGIGAFRAIGLISALNNRRFTGDFNKASNEVIIKGARENFYKLTGLEITNETPANLIKQAYRKSVQTLHPDKGGVEADFIKLQTSYDILTKFNEPIKSNFVKQDKAQEVAKSPLGLAIPNDKSLVEARVNSIPAKVAIEMKPEIQKIQDAYKREVSITQQESVGLERKVQELISVEEAIAEHPLKPIYKYVKNGELPVVTGDANGKFASRGDAIIQELRGYGLSYDNAGDSEQVREEIKGLVDLYARRTELKAELGRTDGTIKDAPLVSVYSIADIKDELVKINTKLADFGMKLNENAKLVPIKNLELPQKTITQDIYQNSNLDSKSIKPAKRINTAESFIEERIGAKVKAEKGFDSVLGKGFLFNTKKATIQTKIRETASEIYLNSIATKKLNNELESLKGSGEGTKLIDALKEYADLTNKKLIIPDATISAKPFWQNIPYLRSDSSIVVNMDGRNYFPPNSFSYTPRSIIANTDVKEGLNLKANELANKYNSKSLLNAFYDAKGYSNYDNFKDVYTMESIMDLSDPLRHKVGRIFINDGEGIVMDLPLTSKIYGKEGNGTIQDYRDAQVPDTTNPMQMVRIYRSVPKFSKEIEAGDWVSFSEEYAKSHERGKVLSKLVPAKDVVWVNMDMNEWVYSPKEIRDQYPYGLKSIWNQANAENTGEATSLSSVKINKSVFTNDEILEIRDFADAKYAKKMNLSEPELAKWEGNIRELLNRKGMNGEKSPSQFTIDIYKILGQANAENITLGRGAIGKTVEQIWEESNSLASPMKGKSYDSQGFIKNEAIKEYSKSVDGISPLGLPEILQLYKDLTGNSPEIKKSLAGALGKAFPGDLGIKLIREIFKDEGLAAKVFAHELGHIIDALPDNAIKKGSLLSKLRVIKDEILTYSEKNKYKEGTGQYRLYEARSEAIRNELLEVADFWRPIELTGKESYRTSNDELFADAFSVLFNAPQLLIEKAPTFWGSLKESMALRPAMFKPLEDIWAIARSGEEAIYKNRYKSIEEMYKGTDKTLEAKIITAKEAGKSILFNLKYGFVDKGQAILDIKGKLNAKGIKTSFEEGGVLDPAVILDEVRMTDSMVEVTIESRYKDFFESLGKDQKVKDLVSQILFLERVAYDPQSASLANPRGFTKSTALAQIESLRKFTDPELLSKADISLKSFREAQDKALADYKASGRIPDDLIAEMEMNRNYATFQVGEHMKLFMSGSIKQRIGTFKDIGDPIAYTMLKDAAVVSAIERSKAKNAVADLFVLTEEAEKAPLHYNGKFMEAVTPSDNSKGVIQYIKDGKLEAYYVDKKAVNFFDNTNDDAVRALGRVLGMPNKFYRAIFTSLSVAFQTRNAPKDFIRTWEMRPDQNLGQAIKSFFSLGKNYFKAIPIAKDRTFDIDNPIIDKMKSEKMLTGDYYTMFSDFDSSTETVLDKVAMKFNLTNRKTSIFDKVLSVLTKANTFIEGLPKIATYLEFKDRLANKETADLVRNYSGTPNFTRSGALSPLSNNIFLFSNIFIQSNKAEWARFSSADTRGTYILKKILMAVIPTLLMYGISKGLFGDEAQHNLEGASEYDKSNYFVLPIGKDTNGKPINIRLPLVENDKVLHGLLWKGLNFENLGKDGLDGIAGIFSYGASQTPNITPFISSVGAVLQYMSGNNIWDDYRGKNVIPDKEFKAGMEYSYPYFIDYLMKLNGVQGVVPTLVDKVQSKEDKGFWEKAGDIPLIGKAISSWIKTSDYGYIEKEQNMQKEADKEAARKSIARMDILKSKVKEIDYGNSNDFNAKKKEIVNEIIKKELNADPNRLNNEQVKSAKTITNWVEDNLLKNSGTKFLSDFGYATTNDEKARLIVRMYKEKGEEKGREALRKLDQMGVISQDLKDKVNNELRK